MFCRPEVKSIYGESIMIKNEISIPNSLSGLGRGTTSHSGTEDEQN